MNRLWQLPSRQLVLENEKVRISAIDLERDLEQLFEAASLLNNGVDLFEYHVNVPTMKDMQTFSDYISEKATQSSEFVYKIFSKRLNKVVGSASLMNVRTGHGTLEVGSIWYSREAQRTEINTNSMYLLFCYIFEELGYRRLEWKCNSKNEASKEAAVRLGFVYEGLFRQHFVSRGDNRDTVWYSIIDSEWDDRKKKIEEKLT